MTESIHRRTLLVPEEVIVPDLGEIYLAEFGESPDIKVLSEYEVAEATGPRLRALGKRLVRVVDQSHGVVTEYSEEDKLTDISFMRGKGSVVLASARPGDPYVWQLMEAREPDAGANVFMVIGVREATAEEHAHLQRAYPGWLDACAEFDDRATAARYAAEQARLLRIRPPALRNLHDEDEPPV